MNLYIVRHAIAAPQGTPGIAEGDRPLTEEGIRKMNEAARGLRILSVQPDLILSSPLPRALQTASIVQKTIDSNIPLKTLECLAPGGSRPEVYEELRREKKRAAIMLVGHQPSLGEIVGEIAWGSAENYIELKKGGTCCLEIEDLSAVPRGSLLWLATPGMLRLMAKRE
jgi:phosphohistidine phosphatase